MNSKIKKNVIVLETWKQITINGFKTTILLNLKVDYIKEGLHENSTFENINLTKDYD